MSNTYASVFCHLVFSTKNRVEWIHQEIENRVWSYLGGVARKHRMTALKVGGIEDHVHSLILTPPRFAPSQVAQFLKGDSSHWIHGEFLDLRDFEWQDGYGAFSVSKSDVPGVMRYIQDQGEHHRRQSFQEEYREFLRAHGIEFDERYLWG